jgi:hypothetical protein
MSVKSTWDQRFNEGENMESQSTHSRSQIFPNVMSGLTGHTGSTIIIAALNPNQGKV